MTDSDEAAPHRPWRLAFMKHGVLHRLAYRNGTTLRCVSAPPSYDGMVGQVGEVIHGDRWRPRNTSLSVQMQAEGWDFTPDSLLPITIQCAPEQTVDWLQVLEIVAAPPDAGVTDPTLVQLVPPQPDGCCHVAELVEHGSPESPRTWKVMSGEHWVLRVPVNRAEDPCPVAAKHEHLEPGQSCLYCDWDPATLATRIGQTLRIKNAPGDWRRCIGQVVRIEPVLSDMASQAGVVASFEVQRDGEVLRCGLGPSNAYLWEFEPADWPVGTYLTCIAAPPGFEEQFLHMWGTVDENQKWNAGGTVPVHLGLPGWKFKRMMDDPAPVIRSDQDRRGAYDHESFAQDLDAVLTEARTLLINKNRAYGNSALDPVRIFSKASPREQLLVLLDDKISRLQRGEAAGEDVLHDLLGYLVLLRIAERRQERNQETT